MCTRHEQKWETQIEGEQKHGKNKRVFDEGKKMKTHSINLNATQWINNKEKGNEKR